MAKRPLILCLALLFVPSFIAADRPSLFVKRVVDGDTLVLSTNEKIRLIGVDAPELHKSQKLYKDALRTKHDATVIQKLGARSAWFTKSLIEKRAVWMTHEPGNIAHNKDKYGRILAYVYFDPPACDDLDQALAEEVCELDSFEKGFLNALIIEAGYANAYTKFPFSYMDMFRRLQRDAREHKRGLWKNTGPLT